MRDEASSPSNQFQMSLLKPFLEYVLEPENLHRHVALTSCASTYAQLPVVFSAEVCEVETLLMLKVPPSFLTHDLALKPQSLIGPLVGCHLTLSGG